MKPIFNKNKKPERPRPAGRRRGGARLILLFIIAVITAAVFSPLASFKVSAETGLTGSGKPGTDANQTGATLNGSGAPADFTPFNPPPSTDNGATVIQGANNPGAQAGAIQNKGAPNNKPNVAECFSILPPNAGFHIEACAANMVYLIMWVFSWILWLAGKILDMSLYYTLNLNNLLSHVPVVDIGWRIFRDLANIFFIFILLWVAIGTILGLVGGKTKEMIVNLIVVALLMNFSLFITKAVIDGSNIVAIHFYNLIVTPIGNTGGTATQRLLAGATPNGGFFGTSSFSAAFMEGLKIQTIYQPQTAGGQNLQSGNLVSGVASEIVGGTLNFGKVILIGIFGIILMITAAYVFLVAAILFIIRVVVLMMVMILSPLGFLSFALPATEKYAELWKEKLISQSLFAPIYLAITFVVVKTIQSGAFRYGVMSVNRQDTAASAASAAALIFGADTGSAAGLAFVFNFILLIGLMLGSILVAKKMEAVGVETTVKLGKEARAFVGRQVARGTYITPVAAVAGRIPGVSRGTEVIGEGLKKLPGFKKFGESVSKLGKNLGSAEGREKIQKGMDINEWDKSFRRSKFGATSIGEFIREKTTGGKLVGTKAKFGGEKSVGEAYEEDEKLRARRAEIANEKIATTAMGSRDDAEKISEELKALIKSKPTLKQFTNVRGEIDFEAFYQKREEWVMEMYKHKRKDFAQTKPAEGEDGESGTSPPTPPPPPSTPAPPPSPTPPSPPGGSTGENMGWQQTGPGRFQKTYK